MRSMPRTLLGCSTQSSLAVLIFLSLAAGPALAGPNGGGTLIVHDTGQTFSRWDDMVWPAPPASCEAVDNQAMVGMDMYNRAPFWQVCAAFPAGSSPRLKALAFGEHLTLGMFILGAEVPNPAEDFEIPQDGWPSADGGGIAISFLQVKTDLICEVYRFWGYAYYEGDIFATRTHPTNQSIFVDDSTPPREDPIAGFSSLGFGVPGVTVCPEAVGACCFADGTCLIRAESDCTPFGGVFLGDVHTCDPNPCGPVPTQTTSWGKIKATYR